MGGRLVDDSGKLKSPDELFGDKKPGSTRIIFKPSAKPGVPGVFVADQESMRNLMGAEQEFLDEQQQALIPQAFDLMIEFLAGRFEKLHRGMVPGGLLNRWRFKWFKAGYSQALADLTPEDAEE